MIPKFHFSRFCVVPYSYHFPTQILSIQVWTVLNTNLLIIFDINDTENTGKLDTFYIRQDKITIYPSTIIIIIFCKRRFS